jgi:hypothetical protein
MHHPESFIARIGFWNSESPGNHPVAIAGFHAGKQGGTECVSLPEELHPKPQVHLQ